MSSTHPVPKISLVWDDRMQVRDSFQHFTAQLAVPQLPWILYLHRVAQQALGGNCNDNRGGGYSSI